jgi:hypothetical protein
MWEVGGFNVNFLFTSHSVAFTDPFRLACLFERHKHYLILMSILCVIAFIYACVLVHTSTHGHQLFIPRQAPVGYVFTLSHFIITVRFSFLSPLVHDFLNRSKMYRPDSSNLSRARRKLVDSCAPCLTWYQSADLRCLLDNLMATSYQRLLAISPRQIQVD